MTEFPLTGNIKDISLVKILVFLNRNRKTGTLVLKTPVYTKKAFLTHGDAVFASSTYEDDRLGEMLLKVDKITVEQYDKSVSILTSSKNKRLGAILVELGYITPKDLFWGVKFQVKEIIYSMFLMEDADYEFIEGDLPTAEVITLKMSMGNLIYEGVKRITSWNRIRNEMPDTSSLIRLSSDPLSLFQGIELSSQDKKILSMVDGKKTMKEIIDGSWMGSFEALKILYVLWSIGIIECRQGHEAAKPEAVEVREETVSLEDIFQPHTEEDEALLKKIDAVYARLGSLSPFQLLEAGPGATSDTIKKNYFRLTKEFHPDRYFSTADETVKTKLTAIFDSLVRAFNTIKDEEGRRKYKVSLAGPAAPAKGEGDEKAEKLFKEGVEEFKKGNLAGAAERFKAAAGIAPKNAQYWNYLSLAYSRMPEKMRAAEEALAEAIKIEPMNPDFHANIGLIYLKAGLKKRAQASFQKALQIDPQNPKAKKGLEQSKK